MTVGGDTSIIGRLMGLVDEDVKKELKDQHWKEVVKSISDTISYPTKNEAVGYDEDGNFIGFKDPKYLEMSERKTDFDYVMGEYLKEVESLKGKILKIKRVCSE